MHFNSQTLKGSQKFHSRFPFFPDFDTSMPVNAHPLTRHLFEGFCVAEYKSEARFWKFKMADSVWWTMCHKSIIIIVESCLVAQDSYGGYA